MPQTFRAGDNKVIWAEDQFMRDLDAQVMKNMAMALTFLKMKTQQNVSKPARQRSGGMVHSKPGEFPRVIEGDLRRSIFTRGPRRTGPNGRIVEGDVGTALDYAIYHEVYTGRSFLRRTLIEEQKRVGQILSSSIGQKR